MYAFRRVTNWRVGLTVVHNWEDLKVDEVIEILKQAIRSVARLFGWLGDFASYAGCAIYRLPVFKVCSKARP